MKDAASGTDRIEEGFRRLALVAGVCLAAAATHFGLAFVSDKVQQFRALGGADDGGDSIIVSVLFGIGFAVAGFGAGWGAVRTLGWVVDGFVNGRAKPNGAPPVMSSTPTEPRAKAIKTPPEQIPDPPIPDPPIPPLLAETAAKITSDETPDAAIHTPVMEDKKIEEEAHKIQLFNVLCQKAEKSVDRLYDPDDKKREQGRMEFEELKLKALDLAEVIEDDFYHGASVQSVVSLCLRAAQIDEAKNLIEQIRDENVKERALQEVGEYE